VSRRLHFVGSLGVPGFVAAAMLARDARRLIGAPVCGYGFAGIGSRGATDARSWPGA